MYQKRNFGIMPRTFGGLMEDMLQSGINRFHEEVNVFSAPVNIQETDKAYELQVIAPGIRKEEVKINVEKNLLNIAYEHKEETTEEQTQAPKWLRNEFRYRSFRRSFTLNDKIDTNHISAKYADGILHITLSKKETAEVAAKEIAVA